MHRSTDNRTQSAMQQNHSHYYAEAFLQNHRVAGGTCNLQEFNARPSQLGLRSNVPLQHSESSLSSLPPNSINAPTFLPYQDIYSKSVRTPNPTPTQSMYSLFGNPTGLPPAIPRMHQNIQNIQKQAYPPGFGYHVPQPDHSDYQKMTALPQMPQQLKAHVFWDFEKLSIPTDRSITGYVISRKILDFLKHHGVSSVNLVAVGSVDLLPNQLRVELQNAGFSILDSSKKSNAADVIVLTEVIKTVYENKPPYMLVFICGNVEYCKLLNWLENVGYTVLFIHLQDISELVISSLSGKQCYLWSSVSGVEEPQALVETHSPAASSSNTPSLSEKEWASAPPPDAQVDISASPEEKLPPTAQKANSRMSYSAVATSGNKKTVAASTQPLSFNDTQSIGVTSSSSPADEQDLEGQEDDSDILPGVELPNEPKLNYCEERFLPLLREARKMVHNEALVVKTDAKLDPNQRLIKTVALVNIIKAAIPTIKKKKAIILIAVEMKLIEFDEENDGIRVTPEGMALIQKYKRRIVTDIVARVPVLEAVEAKFRKHFALNFDSYIDAASELKYINFETLGSTYMVSLSEELLSYLPAPPQIVAGASANTQQTSYNVEKWAPLIKLLRTFDNSGAVISAIGSSIGANNRNWMLQFGEKFRDCIERAEKEGVVTVIRSQPEWKVYLRGKGKNAASDLKEPTATGLRVTAIIPSQAKSKSYSPSLNHKGIIAIADGMPVQQAFEPSGGRFVGLDEEGNRNSIDELVENQHEKEVTQSESKDKGSITAIAKKTENSNIKTQGESNWLNSFECLRASHRLTNEVKAKKPNANQAEKKSKKEYRGMTFNVTIAYGRNSNRAIPSHIVELLKQGRKEEALNALATMTKVVVVGTWGTDEKMNLYPNAKRCSKVDMKVDPANWRVEVDYVAFDKTYLVVGEVYAYFFMDEAGNKILDPNDDFCEVDGENFNMISA
ncbi:hypothetical protein HK098_004300 [Nowakowskiella sp. JEL0407]|nr:hypothetical protein HK098_004300 [Nowakowskiella sp. JEL0407]